jgi:hypothetical protein
MAATNEALPLRLRAAVLGMRLELNPRAEGELNVKMNKCN